ncbi:MAG TPA: tetratricopeptide repeat protein [Bacteroidia bacterium]|nr:tetratricopeptide repeat protein [Bacteroidia bacterium]
MKKLLHILLFLIAVPLFVAAQPPGGNTKKQDLSADEQLAAQYYQSGDYDKATVYYEKLYNSSPITLYYNYYLNCLIFTKDFKKAEKLVSKQQKRNPADLRGKVDMGRVYQAEGEDDKAKKEFSAAIDGINSGTSANSVIDLANSFLGINETDYAISALLKGRKELKGVYSFNMELAEIYNIKKDYQSMVNEYLGLLDISEGYRQSVQNNLQAKMDADQDNKIQPILKDELIKRAQKDPDKIIWPEMLMWLYMQQKNFSAALVQARAIDKRTTHDGSNVMDLAATARANGEYDVATDAYDYVIGLGKNGDNYRKARTEKVNTKYDKITVAGNYTQADLLALETEMNSTLDELGRDAGTVPLMRTLAHLEAFYLFKTKEAISILEQAIAMPGVTPMDQANCKLELGDVLLLDGQVWEASLRYSQVEKAFKYEPIGEEAKFRNAKVAFYIGDFKWAQVQLDVLKGATSRLISNDAMYLSLLITDNLALDSNPEPLLMFARADLLIFQNRFDKATLELDSIDKKYPSHSLEDDVLYKRYEIADKQQKYTDAAGYLDQILQKYPTDILGDDAMFGLAQLYDYKLNDKDKAKKYYLQLITDYPGSLYVVDARKRYRILNGDKIAN